MKNRQIQLKARQLLSSLLEATPTATPQKSVRLRDLFGLSIPAEDALQRLGATNDDDWSSVIANAPVTEIFSPRDIQDAIMVGLEQRGWSPKDFKPFIRHCRFVTARFSDFDSANLSHAGAYWTMDVDIPQGLVDRCPDCMTDNDLRKEESIDEMTSVSGVATVDGPPLGVMASPNLKSAKTSPPKSDDAWKKKRKKALARMKARRLGIPEVPPMGEK